MGPAGLEDGDRTINNPKAHVEDYWSRHPGGANMLFADGSVHFLKASISPIPWRAMATRASGEVISGDSYWNQRFPGSRKHSRSGGAVEGQGARRITLSLF